jgi:hypothetical protein
MRTYELKLASGTVVRWQGSSGVSAAERYVDCHRDAVVVAWREPRVQLLTGGPVSC